MQPTSRLVVAVATAVAFLKVRARESTRGDIESSVGKCISCRSKKEGLSLGGFESFACVKVEAKEHFPILLPLPQHPADTEREPFIK